MTPLKIAIIGTRGIPNRYGGFEQLAEMLSVGLLQKGHSVTVYNSHKHPYQEKDWKGVKLIHCYDAEHIAGTAGQFIYDLNCIRNARKNDFDVLLFLGYTSSSVWGRLFPKNAIVISNMDGLEWKRTKYAKPVRRFLKYAERLAIKHSDFFIADSIAIQKYLHHKYNIVSEYIAYGATIIENTNDPFADKENYFMLMARMEPENNIEMILDGFHQATTKNKFIVVGKTDNAFGKKMRHKYKADKRIMFIGAEYDAQRLHDLKNSAAIYFHGHSVGGTNPSLLEAMASKVLIAAHDNEFNRAVLQEEGYYFSSVKDVQELIENIGISAKEKTMIEKNLKKITEQYTWDIIIDRYDTFIRQCYTQAR